MASVDDFLCLTLVSNRDEAEDAFKSRLSAFWTHMLRDFPDDFEKVYAETTAFENLDGRLERMYLLEDSVAELVETEARAAGLDLKPIDFDDRYTKYEAAPPDWMWIEH